MKIEKQKKNLRIVCSKKRDILNNLNHTASIDITKKILKIKEFKSANIIASFISIKSEISTEFLNDYLFKLGKKICLPVIIDNNKHLIFRLYDKKNKLVKGKFNILEPDNNQKEVLPDIILTPCLAFDKYGYRLGYGGGYYDRTFLNYYKLKHVFVSVALAFDDQKLNKVVRNKYDKKIDYILTEKKLYSIS